MSTESPIVSDDLVADILLAENGARDEALLLATAPDYGQFEDGDFETRCAIIRELVHEGADINAVNLKNGNTPLCNAIVRNELNLVDYLLSLGALLEPDTKENTRHVAPFHLASWSNRTLMMEHLLLKGAKLDHQDPTGANALFYAAEAGAHDAMNFLAQQGVSPTHRDRRGHTALCRISLQDDVSTETLQKLLEMHATSQDRDDDIRLAISSLEDPKRDRQNRYVEAARYHTRSFLEGVLSSP